MNIVVGPLPHAPCISLLLHGHDNIRMECVSAHTCGLGAEMGGGGYLNGFLLCTFCCCLQNSNKTTHIYSVPLCVSLSYRVEIRL